MWAWGEGREVLAWEDRMGGSQARQSMKQLTGAGKGGQGEGRGKLSRGLGNLGDAPITPQEAEQNERKPRLAG